MANTKNSVLFVCMGNICRSPIAEAVFSKLVKDAGISEEWAIDSCGTIGYHKGKDPDQRALKVIKEKCSTPCGCIEYKHKARTIAKQDFVNFKYILVMDKDCMTDLGGFVVTQFGGTKTLPFRLLGEFDPENVLEVRDPYYDDGDEGFYECFDHCLRSCTAFLAQVQEGKI